MPVQCTLLLDARFWKYVDASGDCWEWRGGRNMRGYGQYHVDQWRTVQAHRYAYWLTVMSIPDGLELDHLCRNKGCVNPDHLEPVTHAENVRRSPAR